MRCPRCGKNVPSEDRFCAYCGAALPARRALADAGGPGIVPIVLAIVAALVLVAAGIGAYSYARTRSVAARVGGLASASSSALPALLAPPTATPPPPPASPTAAPAASPATSSAVPAATGASSAATSGAALRGRLLYAFVAGDSSPGIRLLTLPAGTQDTPLPAGSNTDYPDWLPDGSGFICVDEGNASILRVAGGVSRRLTGGRNASLSPDGKSLLFIDGAGTRVMVASADGTGAKALTSGAEVLGPRFSPDGTKIAYTRLVGKVWQVWVMDADGGNGRQVTQSPDHARYPVWSPDGTQLAFNTGQPSDPATPKDIWLIGADGQHARMLVTGGQNGRPFWSGDDVFFNSNRDNTAGGSDIYAIHPDGSGLVRLTNGAAAGGSDFNPVWYPAP